jgi:hypothetical protein
MNRSDPGNEILNSWKEVAYYLGRGVRTVQRWEHELGLPVRRPRGKSRSPIMAFREELDSWLIDCPQATSHHNGNGISISSGHTNGGLCVTDIVGESQDLRYKSRQLRNEMSVALQTLISNLKQLYGSCGNGLPSLAREIAQPNGRD